ncbi:urease accessory protein UreD [Nocardia camponoti]|uniref:urease accessory protein UreD n=1 Tax=Nocardia camponoti TaxID=1616106 RepID=UPI001664C144|nr:urease accessory protein UreD [Nocardia camponoti]
MSVDGGVVSGVGVGAGGKEVGVRGSASGLVTRVVVRRNGSHVDIECLDRGEFLVPRLLDVTGHQVRVALVGCCAMLVAGDALELDVVVGAGIDLELVEPSGTVAYNARGGRASWTARVTVESDGVLRWRTASIVIASGADLTRDMRVDLADGARAVLSETVVLGRSGEVGGALRSRQHVTYAGTPLLIEDLDLTDPTLRDYPGILGAHRVLGTVLALGYRPGALPTPSATALAGPGALARALSAEAHTIDDAMHEWWTAWQP